MAKHGYVGLQVQYSCTEKWSMARTDRSPRDSRCDVSMGGETGRLPRWTGFLGCTAHSGTVEGPDDGAVHGEGGT